MLSTDLAALYCVEPRSLHQAVKRNAGRFPGDFMFRLTAREFANLRSQTVMSSWGGSRRAPMAFTQEGVAMLSSVLRSPQAVRVNVEIMCAFVHLRGLLVDQGLLGQRLEALEARYDRQFKVVFDAMRALGPSPRTAATTSTPASARSPPSTWPKASSSLSGPLRARWDTVSTPSLDRGRGGG